MAISSINLLPNSIGASPARVQAGPSPQSSLATQPRKEGSAIAQLSAFGQVKASLADLQNKAHALKNLSKPPTFQDFQLVVQGFVQSLNSLNRNASQLTSKQGTLSADNRPGQILNGVRQAVVGTNQNSLSSLHKMGISQQANGTLSINQKQMKKSFQDNRPSALASMHEVANRVAQVADTQIAANDYIGKKANNLSTRVNEFENTRGAAQGYQDKQRTFQQSLPAQLTSSGSSATRTAVASYNIVAAL